MYKSMNPKMDMAMASLKGAAGIPVEAAQEAAAPLQLKAEGKVMTNPQEIIQYILDNKDRLLGESPEAAMAEEDMDF